MEIKQIDMTCETFKIDSFGIAYVFDMFEEFARATFMKSEYMTCKVQFTNVKCSLSWTARLSFHLVGEWINEVYTTLALHYETSIPERFYNHRTHLVEPVTPAML